MTNTNINKVYKIVSTITLHLLIPVFVRCVNHTYSMVYVGRDNKGLFSRVFDINLYLIIIASVALVLILVGFV